MAVDFAVVRDQSIEVRSNMRGSALDLAGCDATLEHVDEELVKCLLCPSEGVDLPRLLLREHQVSAPGSRAPASTRSSV